MADHERDELGRQAMTAIDTHAAEIVALADEIHQHPEIGFQERLASRLLAEALSRHGMDVEYPIGGLETAFRATRRGRGTGPTVAVLAEYDALPGLGHGCAHNLIAASGLAAAVALAPLMDQLDGTFQVIGTPAEEGGGGKVKLIDAGIFANIDAALMIHHDRHITAVADAYPGDTSLALADLKFAYRGRATHAGSNPHEGANALNGVIKLFTGIDALRQHVRSDARIHGIITHGGDAPNVVPDHAAADFFIRAADRDYLETLVEKVRKIAEGAALMTETTVTITRPSPTNYDVRPSYVLGRRYEDNMRAAGLEVTPRPPTPGTFSTDFGNVSYLMPAATGSFAISREPIAHHSTEVVAAARSDFGHQQMLGVSKAMALTALDLFLDPDLLARAKDEHAHWAERYLDTP
jgi:amidohydrolase